MDNLKDYFITLLNNLLSLSSLGETALTLNTINFDMLTQILYECEFLQTVFDLGNDDSPLFEFERRDGAPCLADMILKVKLAALNSNAFDCKDYDMHKNSIGIEILDIYGNLLNY